MWGQTELINEREMLREDTAFRHRYCSRQQL